MMSRALPKQLEELTGKRTRRFQPKFISFWVIFQLEAGHPTASNVTLTFVNLKRKISTVGGGWETSTPWSF